MEDEKLSFKDEIEKELKLLPDDIQNISGWRVLMEISLLNIICDIDPKTNNIDNNISISISDSPEYPSSNAVYKYISDPNTFYTNNLSRQIKDCLDGPFFFKSKESVWIYDFKLNIINNKSSVLVLVDPENYELISLDTEFIEKLENIIKDHFEKPEENLSDLLRGWDDFEGKIYYSNPTNRDILLTSDDSSLTFNTDSSNYELSIDTNNITVLEDSYDRKTDWSVKIK